MSRKNTQGDLFSAMLFPNEAVSYDVVTKPFMASTKLDGVRCIFKNGEMLSRSFKPIESKQLNQRFAHMKLLSMTTGLIYDGELYSHELNFQELMHFVRTEDLKDEALPESIEFNFFDAVDMQNLQLTAKERLELYKDLKLTHVKVIEQRTISTPEEARAMFKEVTDNGYEGLILKNPDSLYKFGRVTSKSGDGYKFKPYVTYDAKIIGVEQATKVDPNAERKVNELGYHKTSQKKDDRILIEKASAFLVKYGDHDLKVTLALTDEEKEEVWQNRESYNGRWIEYKGMEVGAKDVPRHPVLVRFRTDKDV
jgi:DNA ligase-1